MSFRTDLSDSTYEFENKVWPQLRLKMGGELMVVEGNADKVMQSALDIQAGIDAWHINHEYGMRGIGSRIQWVCRSYDTFTYRLERASGAMTEYEKRRKAIIEGGGWIYPHLTVHAYIENPRREGALICYACAKTTDIIDYIERFKDSIKIQNVKNNGAASFYVIPWSHFKASGYPLCGSRTKH